MDKEYFRQYYQKHKDKIKAERKKKYAEDEEYRKKVKAYCKKHYTKKKKGNKNAKTKEGTTGNTGQQELFTSEGDVLSGSND